MTSITRGNHAEYEHDKWAFSLSPSERRASWQRVLRLRDKVERLRDRATKENDRE